MRCKQCGKSNHSQARFCASCGSPLESAKPELPVRKKNHIVLLVAIFAILAAVGTIAFLLNMHSINPSDETQQDTDASVSLFSLDNLSLTVKNEGDAREAVARVSQLLDAEDMSSQLGFCRKDTAVGRTCFRFSFESQGLPVIDRSLILVTDKDGTCTELIGDVGTIAKVDTNPTLTPEEATTIACDSVQDCVVHTAPSLAIRADNSNAQLVYILNVRNDSEDYRIIVSATSGEVLSKEPLTSYENIGTLHEQTYGLRVYDAKNDSKSNPKTTITYSSGTDENGQQYTFEKVGDEPFFVDEAGVRLSDQGDWIPGLKLYKGSKLVAEKASWNSVTVSDEQQGVIPPAEVDVQNMSKTDERTMILVNNVLDTYRFFEQVLGRKSFNGRRGRIELVTNAKLLQRDEKSDDSENASSSGSPYCTVLMFGFANDGSIDAVSHEFAHSVESVISNMDHRSEAGALKEATSDIFGELVEDFEDDDQLNDSCDWVHHPGKHARNLAEPEKTENPASYRGKHYLSTDNPDANNDYGEVHKNSTVISHAFFLMRRGNLEGEALTTTEIAKLLYAALFQLTKNSNFSFFAGVTQRNAEHLLTKNKQARVRAAFEEVGVIPLSVSHLKRNQDNPSPNDETVQDAPELGSANTSVVSDGTNLYLGVEANGSAQKRGAPAIARVPRSDYSASEILWSDDATTCVSTGYEGNVRLSLWKDHLSVCSMIVNSGEHVTQDVICVVDANSGNVEWRTNVRQSYDTPSSTPVVAAGKLFYATFSDDSGTDWDIRSHGLDDGLEQTICSGTWKVGETANIRPLLVGEQDSVVFFTQEELHRTDNQYATYVVPAEGGSEVKVLAADGLPVICNMRIYTVEGDSLVSYSLQGEDRKAIAAFGNAESSTVLKNVSKRYAIVECAQEGQNVQVIRLNMLTGNQEFVAESDSWSHWDLVDDDVFQVDAKGNVSRWTGEVNSFESVWPPKSTTTAEEESSVVAEDSSSQNGNALQEIEAQSGRSVLWSDTADYDGDGTLETFALVGETSATEGEDDRWPNVNLWLRTSSGDVTSVCSLDGQTYVNGSFKDTGDSGKRLLSLEVWTGGSGTRSVVYTIDNDCARQVFSECREVQLNDGKMVGAKDVFSNGHKVEWYSLRFVPERFELLEEESLGIKELYELP